MGREKLDRSIGFYLKHVKAILDEATKYANEFEESSHFAGVKEIRDLTDSIQHNIMGMVKFLGEAALEFRAQARTAEREAEARKSPASGWGRTDS